MTPRVRKLLKTYLLTIVHKYLGIQIWSITITWHTHIIITLTFDVPKCEASCTLKISFFWKMMKSRNPEDIDHESSSVMSPTWKRIKRYVEWHVQTSGLWNFDFSKFRLIMFCLACHFFFEKVIKFWNPEIIDHESSFLWSLKGKRIKRYVV